MPVEILEEKKRKVLYCWLNILTGEFSDSWDEETHKECLRFMSNLFDHADSNWKLIKFECLTDENFSFTNHMKLR